MWNTAGWSVSWDVEYRWLECELGCGIQVVRVEKLGCGIQVIRVENLGCGIQVVGVEKLGCGI